MRTRIETSNKGPGKIDERWRRRKRMIVVVIMRNCLITANDVRLFRLLNQRGYYRFDVILTVHRR